jgi:adenosyl cobinamide kinase/adenosyl cobinamide phosphate guanylyltransferase
MLYLLGGAARSGKSIIARRVMAQYHMPFFSLDYLTNGMAQVWPELQNDLDTDDATVGERIWPVVKSIAAMILRTHVHYLLEGASLQPHHASELILAFPNQVHACFVGFADADITEKFQHVRQFGDQPDDWMAHWDDALVVQELERLKGVSRAIQAECQQLHLPYFETSLQFEHSISSVVQHIGQELRQST